MDPFAEATAKIENEEEWSDHAADSGGKTKWGAAIGTLLEENFDYNKDGAVDLIDLRGMTREQARELYRKNARAGSAETSFCRRWRWWCSTQPSMPELDEPRDGCRAQRLQIRTGSQEEHE